MPYIDTSVYVDFADYHDDELIEELEDRGYIVSKTDASIDLSIIEELRKEYRTYGYTEKFRDFLDRFFRETLG